MIKISAVIITYNEEKNIAQCIDSLKPVADEIIVVDSFSTDATKTICMEKGVRFYENAFEGHIQQKNKAVSFATYDFVLSLDADEYLSKELGASILQVKQNGKAEAYSMNRLSSLGGKWIRSTDWYPDKKLRLWNKSIGEWGGYNPHDKVIINEGITVSHLKGNLMHEAYQNVSGLIGKLQSYSSIYASEHAFRKRVTTWGIFYKTITSFFKNYFLKRGILDGYEGLIISGSNAYGVMYKYAKLLELNRSLKVSLVITTYNRKDALELVLLSVMNQTILPSEVIVADDGSTQDTKQLIDSYVDQFNTPLKHCWQDDSGFRLAAIRNKAIAMSKFDYIIFVDGDIVLHSEFIRDHILWAQKGIMIQGSRLLLGDAITKKAIQTKKLCFSFFERGIKNRKNAIHSKIFAKLFSYRNDNIYRMRGANLAFWRDDALRVNGFNENFVGWGREDSEFAARIQNAGVKKFHLKFAAIGYHLYHPERTREGLLQNESILKETVTTKLMRCENGVDKYVKSAETIKN